MLPRVLSTQECIYGRSVIKTTDVEQMTTIMMETKTLATVVDGHCLAAWSTFWCIMLEIGRERENMKSSMLICCELLLRENGTRSSSVLSQVVVIQIQRTTTFYGTFNTFLWTYDTHRFLPSSRQAAASSLIWGCAAGWGFVEWWNFVATKLSKCRPGSVGCSLG